MADQENKIPHDLSDRGYKLFLSFTKIFQQLIEGYVEEDWKDRLDYERSQRIDKSFILKELEKEEADVFYKVPLIGAEKEIFLYILIEQQSTVDYSLAFRVLAYLVDLWKDIYKNTDKKLRRQKGFRLQPVFPIVLYNGSDSWTSSMSVRELVEQSETFGDFIPNVLYHLVDIPRCDVARLKKIGNSLAGIFLLEHENTESEFEAILQDSLSIIDQETDCELWKSIVQWVIAKLKRELPEQAGKMLETVDLNEHNRKEIRSMLETMPKKLLARGKREGIIEVLEARFGEVSEEIIEELKNIAQIQDLTALVKKAATACNLKEFRTALTEALRQR